MDSRACTGCRPSAALWAAEQESVAVRVAVRVQVRLVVQVGRQEVTALWPEFFFAAQVHVVVLERLLVVLVLERLPVVLEPLVL